MKTLAIVALFAASVLLSSTAFAGTTGSVEVFFQPERSAAHPSADLFLAHHFDKYGLGVSSFALITEGWGELYAGPTWAPAEWVELSLSIGIEQTGAKTGLRLATSVWIGHGPFSFSGAVEFNPQSFQGNVAGVWFDLTPKYQALDWFAVGAKYRRGVGVGPLVELVLPTSPSAAVWLSWLPIDPEKVAGKLFNPLRFIVGLQGRF